MVRWIQWLGGCGGIKSYRFKFLLVLHPGVASHDIHTRSLQILYDLVGQDGDTGAAPIKWVEVVEEAL